MSYTETTYSSWFERIKKALAGIIIGFVLLVGSIWLLIWNEGRAINTYRALEEGAAQVVSIDALTHDPAFDGKLVHISAPVSVEGRAQDDMFGVSAENAVAISRSVEMYQWVEKSDSKTEKKVGGGEETTTTYTYGKEWRSEPVRSSEFKHPEGHDNPGSMPASETFTVRGTHVGAFEVPAQMVADVGQRAGLAITDNDVSAVAAALGGDRSVKRDGEGVYVGDRPSAPAIGDLKLSFDRVDAKEASFVGKQQGSSLTAYTSGNGREIFLSAGGRVDAASMFKSAESENNVIAWLLRVAGLVLMFIGFVCIFAIFGVIGDVIPFVGSIVSFGTSLLAFVLTLVFGSLAIAFGWLAYRPLLAAGIIAVALVVAVVVFRRRSAVAKPA